MTKVHPKVKAAGLAGACTTILIGVLHRLGVDATPEEASALTVVFAFVAGYVR